MTTIPGLAIPPGLLVLGEADTLLSFRASSTSSTTTISRPTGTSPGDILVMWDMAVQISGTPASVTPSGWTNLRDLSGGGARHMLHCRIADGTEGSTFTGMSTTGDTRKIVACFEAGAASISMPSTGGGQSTGGNPNAQTVSASTLGADRCIVIAGYSSTLDGPVTPRTFSPAKDGEVNNGTSLYLAWKIYNAGDSRSNHSIDMNDHSNTQNALVSNLINVT